MVYNIVTAEDDAQSEINSCFTKPFDARLLCGEIEPMLNTTRSDHAGEQSKPAPRQPAAAPTHTPRGTAPFATFAPPGSAVSTSPPAPRERASAEAERLEQTF